MVHQRIEDAPAWAVPYGKEFWRRQTKPAGNGPAGIISANIDLGDSIDRVSHAIGTGNSIYPEVNARNYTAAFDGRGLRFSPHRAADRSRSDTTAWPQADTGTVAVVRTVSIRQGAASLYERDARPSDWSLLGNTAQAWLNPQAGLIEHYETTRRGAEISWVLGREPLGKGPGEIVFEVSGLEYAGQSANGHHFADVEGIPRVRIGNAVARDALGARWDAPVSADGNLLRVTLPESILARASFPLVIDPLIEPEFGMDSPVVGPAANSQTGVAVGSLGGDFLVAWSDGRLGSFAVYAARVSGSGAVLDPVGFIVSRSGASPSVTLLGTNYFVVWEDSRNRGTNFYTDIYGARIGRDGVVLDAEGIPICTAPNYQFAPRAASDGTNCLVVWQQVHGSSTTADDIYGTIVTSRAEVLNPNGVPISSAPGDQTSPLVAAGGGAYLVTWTDERDGLFPNIYGARVTYDGITIDTNGIPICTATNGQYLGSVASDRQDWFVAWTDFRNPDSSRPSIFGTRVSREGTVSQTNGIPISQSNVGQRGPAVVFNGSDYLVAWSDQRNYPATGFDLYAARVANDGLLVPGSEFPLNLHSGDQGTAAVAFNGTDYLAVWSDGRNDIEFPDLYGTLVNKTNQVSAPDGMLISEAANDQQAPAAAFNGRHYLVVWEDNRNGAGTDIYGVRLSSTGQIADPSGISICTAPGLQRHPSVASDGTDFLVVWADERDSASSGSDIYGARVQSTGVVVDGAGLPICTETSFQVGPCVAFGGGAYLVAWQDWRNIPTTGYDIYGTIAMPAGPVVNTNGFAICSAPKAQGNPAIAFNGATFLVVWSDERNAGNNFGVYDIFGARVKPDSTVLDLQGIPIGVAPDDQSLPSVAAAGSDYLVVWQDARDRAANKYDIYGTRVGAGGDVLDGAGLVICSEANDQNTPVVTANGSEFLVAWTDGRNASQSGLDIYATGVSFTGIVRAGSGMAVHRGQFDQLTPAVLGNSNGSCLVLGSSFKADAFESYRIVGSFVRLDNPPVINGLFRTGSDVSLSWLVETGRVYRIQFKDDLTTATWNELSGDVAATNPVASKVDTTAGSARQRFYRVVQLP
jgi:hypothetical protein